MSGKTPKMTAGHIARITAKLIKEGKVSLSIAGSTTIGSSATDIMTVTGKLSASNGIAVTGDAAFNDGVTLGNQATDVVTVTGQLTASNGMVVTSHVTANNGVTTVSSDLTASNGLLIPDDTTIRFGTGAGDATIEYDENGTNELRFAGAAVTFEQDATFDNDVTLGVVATDTTTVTGKLSASNGINITGDAEITGSLFLGAGKHIQFGDTQTAWGIDSLTTSNATLGYSSDYSGPVLDAKSTSFTVISSTGTANKPEIIITNSNNGSGAGFLSFTKHRGWGGSANRAPIANDSLGGITFREGVSDYTPYAEINVSAKDVTDDAESGKMKFTVKNTGVDNDDLALLGGQISIGSGKHIIAIDQDIRYAHSGDNTVIVELPGVRIPASAIITSVAAVVKTPSNLGTHTVNIQMSATSGTGADSSISSGTELLGAGVTNTDSTDSASAEDINLASADEKEVWVCRDTVRNGSSDQYVYICNAAGSNGTTDSSAGTLTVIIEYYGWK